MSGAISLLPFSAFVAWTGTNSLLPKSYSQAVAQLVFFFCVRGRRSQRVPLREIICFSKSQLGIFVALLYIRLSNLEFLKSCKSISSFKISILPPNLLPLRLCGPGRLHPPSYAPVRVVLDTSLGSYIGCSDFLVGSPRPYSQMPGYYHKLTTTTTLQIPPNHYYESLSIGHCVI
jgi:hypothetical protein